MTSPTLERVFDQGEDNTALPTLQQQNTGVSITIVADNSLQAEFEKIKLI